MVSYFIASVQPTTKFWKCQSINVEHKMHLFMMVAVPNGAKTLASAVKNLVIGKYHLHSSGLLNKLVLNWQLFWNYYTYYYLGGKVFYLVFKIKCKSLLDPLFLSDMIKIGNQIFRNLSLQDILDKLEHSWFELFSFLLCMQL